MYKLNSIKASLLVFCSALILSACGGGSSSPPAPVNPSTGGTNNDTQWIAGEFPPESQFQAKCVNPRSGTDSNGGTYPDTSGTAMDEKMWMRSWSNDTYLWYDEIDDVDPTPFSILDYFDQLKTNQTTDSGAAKDNFHFSESTEDFEAGRRGVESGYGFEWEYVLSSPPREWNVRFTEPGSPAANANVLRGASLKALDGVDFVNDSTNAGIDTLNEVLFPSEVGQTYEFVFDMPDGSELTVNLTSAEVQTTPVRYTQVLDTDAGKMGYVMFNSHIGPAQTGLVDAFQQFVDEGVTGLVLDLRYNGGGLLTMASQVAYMIAGSSQTNNRTFEQLQFNDKYPTTDPVTGQSIDPTPFYDLEVDWDAGRFTSTRLPSVEVSTVYIISTGSTCSASEAIINGLRGIDVEVILIGNKTCGKPYGFYPEDNCGTTYYTIQFQGVNEKGFGDYADGFIPTETPEFSADMQGCVVNDNLNDTLGESSETMLAAAIQHAENNTCPAIPESKSLADIAQDPRLAIRNPNSRTEQMIRNNRIMLPISDIQE